MNSRSSALFSALQADLSVEVDLALPGFAPDSDPKHVACYILRDSLLKKFNEADKPQPSACDAAQEKFLAVNQRCAVWSIPYEHSIDEELIGEVKSELYRFWYESADRPIVSGFADLFHAGHAGPGASIKARGCDFYTKLFDSPLTATGDLTYVWGQLVSQHPDWADATRVCSERWSPSVVEHSNYSFVNKTTTVARGICTEPSVNGFFQLGFGELLTRRLKQLYGYDPECTPDVNRVLAREGSIKCNFCTIDLESASDSSGVRMLHEILPRDFMRWLMLLRCPATRLPNKEVVPLHMVSTMGNGFTFPLMGAIFTAIVKSAYRLIGIPFVWDRSGDRYHAADPSRRVRTFSVWGDDIVVDTRAVRLVLRGLHLLGYVVNKDKTFVEGPFKESCGADYYAGTNVRGVYIKSLKTRQDLFVAINTLNRWTAKTGVSLPCTVSLILSWIRHPESCCVPPDEDDAAGIHTPDHLASISHNRFFSPVYRTEEGVVGGVGVVLRTYRAYVPRVTILGLTREAFEERMAEPKRVGYNPSGLLLSFLGGYIRGGGIALRQRDVSYRTEPRSTPRWGWVRSRPLEHPLRCDEGRRFESACERNLVGSGFGAGV